MPVHGQSIVHISNIDRSADEEDLIEHIRRADLDENLLHFQIARRKNGLSNSHGLATFASEGSAKRLLDAGLPLFRGRQLNVKLHRTGGTSTCSTPTVSSGGYCGSKGKGKDMGKVGSSRGYFDVSHEGAVDVIHRSITSARSSSEVSSEFSIELISSYNFVTRTTPVARLIVPGLPRSFAGIRRIRALKQDTADKIADESHVQIPKYPTIPIFLAVRHQRADFDFDSMDVICDSNDLRKLLGFLRGDCSATSSLVGPGWQRDSSFRLDVDMVCGHTLVLTRYEQLDVVPSPPDTKTFGEAFEKALTKMPLLKEDISSFRAIHKVTLGALIFLVQAEPDACKYENDVFDGAECSGWMTSPVFPSVEIMRSGAIV